MRVFVCDDHELFVDAITIALQDRGHVVGATCDPHQAASQVATHAPDVCVLESSVAGTDCTTVARAIRAQDPAAVIVVLTGEVSDDIWEAYDDGLINGVVNKSRGLEQLERAMVRAAAGERVLDGCERPVRTTARIFPVEPLTKRELEVLLHIVEGNTTDEMSVSLGVSRNTVRTHVQHLLRKLGVHERNKAVRLALDLGLVEASVTPARAG